MHANESVARVAQIGVRRARLPTDIRGAAALSAGLALSRGGSKACATCGKPFRGWGASCHSCRGKTSKTRRSSPAVNDDTCVVCKKKVYDAERLVAAGKI